jgi:hypothetical protein
VPRGWGTGLRLLVNDVSWSAMLDNVSIDCAGLGVVDLEAAQRVVTGLTPVWRLDAGCYRGSGIGRPGLLIDPARFALGSRLGALTIVAVL